MKGEARLWGVQGWSIPLKSVRVPRGSMEEWIKRLDIRRRRVHAASRRDTCFKGCVQTQKRNEHCW